MDNMRPGRYRGVTYFCPAAGCWVILDPVGRLAPRRSSHLVEAETLALFDDARCRYVSNTEGLPLPQQSAQQQALSIRIGSPGRYG